MIKVVEYLVISWKIEKNYSLTHPDGRSTVVRGVGDVLHVPDDTWEIEKNYSMAHHDGMSTETRQIGSDQPPPSTACITIMPIYDRNWVQSSGGDGAAQVKAVLAEAQNIFRAKYATDNRLGTSFTFKFKGKEINSTFTYNTTFYFLSRSFSLTEPKYDKMNTWQATGNDINGEAVRSHVATSSYSTQHYAFFGGSDNGGAIGIAYLGTACLRASEGMQNTMSFGILISVRVKP